MKYVKSYRFVLFSFSILMLSALVFQSCKNRVNTLTPPESEKEDTQEIGYPIALDSTYIAPFFESHPQLQEYEEELKNIYRHYGFSYIWFDTAGLKNYGNSLFYRVKDIEEEGIYATFSHQEDIEAIFKENIEDAENHPDAEMLMTCLYLFYVDVVYKGIDSKTTTDLGWLLPRKEFEETDLLDAVIADQDWKDTDSLMFNQYYRLREVLNRYRKIRDKGGWPSVAVESNQKSFKPKDSSEVIQQIRARLHITGELKENNNSPIYDEDLIAGINKFQAHHGFIPDSIITKEHLAALNTPVEEFIKKIVVNMERSRWVPPGVTTADEFIFVNIPAYKLRLYRKGNIDFESSVVVGSVMTKTVIFDGMMTYLAFSPYWNIPQSIINNEIIPGMEKDENYLQKRNMVWNDGRVRQKPGRTNSLGLVKFMFPNSKAIYLHDTPAKSLFNIDNRARSHGCIRVQNARDLAVKILEDDENWTPEKVDAAMNAGRETTYTLKKEIPVYIGYFTAWVDKEGQVFFFKDVYKRDDRLADLLLYRSEAEKI